MKLVTKPRHKSRQHGFSLLELLVAFAIMVMSLGLLYRMAGGSARDIAAITQMQRAVWLVESILASRNAVRSDGWNEDGESDGFQWRVQSRPYSSGLGELQGVPLHKIELSIVWNAGPKPGHLEVTTLMPERRPRPGETVQ